MTEIKHILVIPTNRDATAAISSASLEVQEARSLGYDIPLVVIETDSSDHVKNNAATLRECRNQDGRLNTIHLTIERQRRIIHRIFASESDHCWRSLFLRGSKDYGTAMNKCFLYSIALGADVVHRRDSDTVTLDHKFRNQQGRLPIVKELSLLGSGHSDHSSSAHSADTYITVVGGNYVGEWNLDVKDLVVAAGDRTILHRLYEVLGFDPASIPDMIEEAFPQETVVPDRDVITPVHSVNDGLNPDCGNVAFMEIHKYLRVVPCPNILASDYFAFDAATSLGLPSIHHSDAVFHEYDSTRKSLSSQLSYWEGIARFADYFNAYAKIYSGNLSSLLGIKPGTLPADSNSREKLTSLVREAAAGSVPERINRVESLANDVLVPLGGDFADIGGVLLRNASRYVDECSVSYNMHADLIELWPELVERCSAACGVLSARNM